MNLLDHYLFWQQSWNLNLKLTWFVLENKGYPDAIVRNKIDKNFLIDSET